MAEAKANHLRGGKQSRRDRTFGIDDPAFWQWWHRDGKEQAEGSDVRCRDDAIAIYKEWIELGRPEVK